MIGCLEEGIIMGRPRKVRNPIWLKFHRYVLGRSINFIAEKYKVSTRTVWRYLK